MDLHKNILYKHINMTLSGEEPSLDIEVYTKQILTAYTRMYVHSTLLDLRR